MISVCLAAYNGEKFISEQVTSILSQLGAGDELIVSDDGSKDSTIAILHRFVDSRLTIVKNTGSHGYVGNFENALRQAKGDYIFLSDQDDVWLPSKVTKVVERLQVYDLVIHDAELIEGNGNPLGCNYYSVTHHNKGFLMNLWKTRWLGCCMAFRRNVLDYCLPFPEKIVAHDYWIGMLGMTKFSYYFMDDVLIQYRRHGCNASPSSEKSGYSWFYRMYKKRLYLLFSLMNRIAFCRG